MQNKRVLDIIIPTKNAGQYLEACLISLLKQIEPVNSIIVVDAHSTDRTIDIAHLYETQYIKEPLSTTKGSRRAVACNEGLKYATSQYVAFLDADTEVPPDWSLQISDYFKRLPDASGLSSGCRSNYTTKLGRAIHSIIGLFSSHGRQFSDVRKLESIPGFNSAYRLKDILAVGGFNEKIGGCEDWELNYRIRNVLKKNLYSIPEAPVVHKERETITAFAKQMFGYAWSRSRLALKTKIFTPQHAIPTVLFISLLLLIPFISLPFLVLSVFLIAETMFTVDEFDINNLPYPIVLFITLYMMFLSWSIGYAKGLIDGIT